MRHPPCSSSSSNTNSQALASNVKKRNQPTNQKMSAKIVEICRSKYGYGFTLSGEMPCRLTQVKGYAQTAGLQSGDRLHAVNGMSVERLTHAQVVAIITEAPGGRLKLTISPGECFEEEEDETTSEEAGFSSSEQETEERSKAKGRSGLPAISSDGGESCSSSSTSSSTILTNGKQLQQQLRSSHSNRGSRNGQQRKHQRTTSRSTVLRPSQTYEATSGPSPAVKLRPRLRTRPTRPLSGNHDPYGLLHLSDSDMPVEKSPTGRHLRPARPKSMHISAGVRFQSIDNLHRPSRGSSATAEEEESLLLHQHYRNRVKCSRTRGSAQRESDYGHRVKKVSEELKWSIAQTREVVRRSMLAEESKKKDGEVLPPGRELRLASTSTANQLLVDVDVHQQAKVQPKSTKTRPIAPSTTSGISSTSPSSGPSSSSNASSPSSTTQRDNSSSTTREAEVDVSSAAAFKVPNAPVPAKRRGKKSTQSQSTQPPPHSAPPLPDLHSHSILRCIIRCLSSTTHHLDTPATSPSPSFFTSLVRHQLTTSLAATCLYSRQPHIDTSIATLLAAYTDTLYLVTCSSCGTKSTTAIKATSLIFCALPLAEEKNYFSLIVRDEESPESRDVRCYLFAVDRSISNSHGAHQELAAQFGLNCTTDPISGNCLEFPENSSQILRVLFSLYRQQLGQHLPAVTPIATNSSQPHPHPQPTAPRTRAPILQTTSFAIEPAEEEEDADEDNVLGQFEEATKSVTLESRGSQSSERTLPKRDPPPPPRTTTQPPPPRDEPSDSSPSCCATTSCDSFSFQQFQAHLQQQLRAQSQPNSLPDSTAIPPILRTAEYDHHHSTRLMQPPQPSSVARRHQPTADQQQSRFSENLPPTFRASERNHYRKASTQRPKSLFSFDLQAFQQASSSNYPQHFLLDSTTSCTDLSYNSAQLEAHFDAAHVRQATAKYLMHSVASNLPYLSSSSSRTAMVSSNLSRDQMTQKMADLSVSSSGLSAAAAPVAVPRPPLVPRSPTISTNKLVRQPTSYDQSYGSDPDEAIFEHVGSASSTAATGEEVVDREADGKKSSPKSAMPDLINNPKTNGIAGHNNSTTSDPVPVPAQANTITSATSEINTGGGPRSDEYGWMESPPEFPISERPVDVGWVGGWATDFDILLSDPIGVKAFTDFLKKEFSYENLQFFLAVQEFKKLDTNTLDANELQAQAESIYETFISPEATEPVNVDSKARKATELALQCKPIDTRVFALPEKQIYNLMKFDSYQRFLKSEIFKECATLDHQGKPLPYESSDSNGSPTANGSPPGSAGSSDPSAASKADAKMPNAKTKRRSLIPWARIKLSIASAKAASLSSNPRDVAVSTFRRPMMMRKFTSSITKIRSKSLDDHINSRIHTTANKHPHASESTGTNTPHQGPHSASIDKAPTQQSFSLADSRNSLAHASESLDLSENVFSPSPETAAREGSDPTTSRLASISTDSTSTEPSPVSASQPTFPPHAHHCTRDNCHLLRVSFPDRSQTVVSGAPNETVDSLIKRLLQKRSLDFAAFDVFKTGENVPLDPTIAITTLGCTELRVEQRVIFQLNLPNDNEVIGVKSKPNLLCSPVFKSLLHRQGYRWEHVLLTLDDADRTPVDMSAPLSSVDGQRVLVSYREDLEEYGWNTSSRGGTIPAALSLKSNSSSGGKSETQQQTATPVTSHSTPPGDDTQSDAFYRELLLQQSPQSPQSSPYRIIPPALLAQHRHFQLAYQQNQNSPTGQSSAHHQSTSSVAYGIVASPPGPVKSMRSLEATGTAQQPIPQMRRFNSDQVHVLGDIDLDSVTSATPAARSRSAHLRDLANHQHFQSYSEALETANRIYAGSTGSNTTQYPLDLNSTAEEIKLLSGQNGHVSHVPPPPPPMPLSMATSSQNHPHHQLENSPPEKPPLRRFTSDPPPPLPPKPSMSTSSSQASNGHLRSRPPTLSTSQKSLPTSLFHPLESATTTAVAAHQHHHHHPHHPSLYAHHFGEPIKYNFLDI